MDHSLCLCSPVFLWWPRSPAGIKVPTHSWRFLTFGFSALRSKAEICREEQRHTSRWHGCDSTNRWWGWIRGSKDCMLLPSPLLHHGRILYFRMLSFLSILWSFWREDVARCLCPNIFFQVKGFRLSQILNGSSFLDLREAVTFPIISSVYFTLSKGTLQGHSLSSWLEPRKMGIKSCAYSNTPIFGHKWKELVCFLVCLPFAPGPELSCRFQHEKRHEVPVRTSGIKSRKLGSVLITLYWQEMKVLIPITFRAPVPTALRGVTHFGTFEREFASPPSLPHLYCFCSTDLSH